MISLRLGAQLSVLVFSLAVIPVAVDAQIPGLEVDDPEMLRYEIFWACGKDELDEDLVADLLDSLGG